VRRLLALSALVTAAVILAGCGGGSSRADIAFVSSRDGDYAIYVMGADGKGERRLSTKSEEGVPQDASVFFQIDPAWSPDATKIAYASVRADSPDIYVMNADGTGETRLTSGKTNDTHPTWSPDGRSISFVRDGDIYVMGSDGSSPRRISEIEAQESDPAWSPDGEWIAYVRRTPGTAVQNLWLMHPDGSGRHALTKQGGRTFTPAWSPDSARIVFSMNRDELFELFTVGVDGKGLRSVVPTANDNFEPSWSPDGSRIAYQEEGAIFTIELGGTDVEKLTDNATNDSSPTWNPVLPGE
jgi:Tol biopolymer transport system component